MPYQIWNAKFIDGSLFILREKTVWIGNLAHSLKSKKGIWMQKNLKPCQPWSGDKNILGTGNETWEAGEEKKSKEI